MKTHTIARISTVMAALAFSVGVCGQARAANDTPIPPEGIEVLARGPVHEAFAEPAVRGPRPTPVVPKAPPEPIEELPPDQKPEGDNVQWIPGYWAWDDERAEYLWVSGTWRVVPPERQWLPGHWNQAHGGWQWVAGFWQPRNQQALEFLPQPPDPVAEAMPAAAKDEVFVPGTWVFRDTRYLWRPGFWVASRPGWVWIPAHYVWTPAGYVFVEGYWDFPLANRGLLFAPVSLIPRVVRPGWVYRPTYVIDYDFLTGALFVRLATNHYYFGDYFDPRFVRLGYTAWVDFRMSRIFYDPLFAYFRWTNRADPAVVQDLQQLYVARREGRASRPPQTLTQQQALVKNRASTAVQRGMPLASLNQAKVALNLQPVAPTRLAAERKVVQQFRELGRARAKAEAQVAVQNPSGATVRTGTPVKVDLTRAHPASTSATTAKAIQPPPLPTAVIHTAGKPPASEAKVGEHPPVVSPEPKPVKPTDKPVIVKPEPKPAPPKPPEKPAVEPKQAPPKPAEKPAVEAKPAPKPPPKPEPKPMGGKPSDKDKKPG
jgi:hypothetical protein